jgi:hypothetical protein
MPPIIPISRQFDQPTLGKIIDADAVVQRYRELFALFDWTALEPAIKPSGPGRPGHPPSAYVKALLVRIGEHLSSTPRWRAYLLDHPLLVLELGFRPHLDFTEPYGFRVDKTVPSLGHLNVILCTLDHRRLSELLAQTVQALQAEIPGLGEVVAYDVKHIYANVKENNPRVYLKDRFCKDRQLKAVTPIAASASSEAPIRSSPMAPRKKSKSTCGATAPGSRPPPSPTTATWPWLRPPAPSTKPM